MLTLCSHGKAAPEPPPVVAQPARQSLLDEAGHLLLDPLVGVFTSNRETQQSVVDGAKALAKTIPLFMSGPLGYVALGATYTADEVKTSDAGPEMALDGLLGLSKASALALTKRFAMSRNASPSLLGVELGVVNRASDTGLTRDNYTDASGAFSLTAGLGRAAVTAFNPISLAADAAAFAIADRTWARISGPTRGSATFDPRVVGTLSGGVFGVSTGAGTEIGNQLMSGNFDALQLVTATAKQGAIGLVSGRIGGWQSGRHLSLGVSETAAEVAVARSTPFQRGEIVDARQQMLRDGQFVPGHTANGALDVQTTFGKVITPNGQQIPAIFRTGNGSEYFAQRQQSEIAMYGLDSKLALDAGSPATVARSVQLDGRAVSGFIQEMRGRDLRAALQDSITNDKLPTATAKRLLAEDPQLRQSFMGAAIKRMLAAQYDNHAMNYLSEPAGSAKSGRTITSIDWDAVRPAQTKLDLMPHPGLRTGWDNSAASLYRHVAGTSIGAGNRAAIDAFRRTHSSGSGLAELKALGFTDRQATGILGRADWFAVNGIMPYGIETPGYHALRPITTALKAAIVGRKPAPVPLTVEG